MEDVDSFLQRKTTLPECNPSITPWKLPKSTVKWGSLKRFHINIFSNFIHNYPNLEVTNMSFSRWVDKYTVAFRHWNAILKQNKLINHDEHGNDILNMSNWMKLIRKEEAMHDSKFMTFQARHTHGDIEEQSIPGLVSDVGVK